MSYGDPNIGTFQAIAQVVEIPIAPDTVHGLVKQIGQQASELCSFAAAVADVISGVVPPTPQDMNKAALNGNGLLDELRMVSGVLSRCLTEIERAQRSL